MKLKDILPEYPVTIMLRCNPPIGFDEPYGILSGYCAWSGSELQPLDGDSYSVNMEVDKYEYNNGYLVVWETIEWK